MAGKRGGYLLDLCEEHGVKPGEARVLLAKALREALEYIDENDGHIPHELRDIFKSPGVKTVGFETAAYKDDIRQQLRDMLLEQEDWLAQYTAAKPKSVEVTGLGGGPIEQNMNLQVSFVSPKEIAEEE